MAKRLDKDTRDVILKLASDPAWPPQRIADFLGIALRTVYNHIEADAAETRSLRKRLERLEDACA